MFKDLQFQRRLYDDDFQKVLIEQIEKTLAPMNTADTFLDILRRLMNQ